MTNLTSVFDNLGSEKIIEKTYQQKNIQSDLILKIGYLTVIRKSKGDKRVKKRFLLTKDHLYFLSGSIRKNAKNFTINYKAKTELRWMQTLFKEKDTVFFDKPAFFFQFVKRNKSVKFQVMNKGDYEIWKRLLTSLTIRREFFTEFKVVSVMGEGSSAKVYKVQNISSLKFFACKRFKKKDLTQSQLLSIVNEIRILRDLKGHPNVIQLESVFESDNSIYLIMELCEGGRCLKRRTFYRPQQVKNLLSQVLDCLLFLKERGIVHRDLKPDNILLKYKDIPLEKNEIRIIDFGLGMFVNETESVRKGGTIGYMAPEALLLPNYLPNYQFDIFSLGVMAYNGITATKLFKDKRQGKMIEKNKKAVVDFDDDIFQRCDSNCKLTSERTHCGFVESGSGTKNKCVSGNCP